MGVADDVRIALLGPLELRAGTALPVVEVAGRGCGGCCCAWPSTQNGW
jgi:hypothetical protein